VTEWRCDRCRWWGETIKPVDYAGYELTPKTPCHEGPQQVYTEPDYWCSRFKPKPIELTPEQRLRMMRNTAAVL
jgi:hypothetical protein